VFIDVAPINRAMTPPVMIAEIFNHQWRYLRNGAGA
jgi:hypothetical protein